MNDLPRRKLGEIITKYGASLIDNPRRCEGLLRDYCGSFRREISVLLMALEERIPLDLLATAKSTSRAVLFGRLTRRLCDNLALSEQAARWSVYSWALALNIISGAELATLEAENNPLPADSAFTPAAQIQSAGVQTDSSQTAKTALNRTATRNSLIVSARGDADFTSIAQALKVASPNSRLLIRPGVYRESFVLDKNVEIVGDGAVGEIIVASADSSCIQMQNDQAAVRNLTLQGRGAARGKAFFAVDIPRGALVLENCDITSDTLSCIAVHGVDAAPTIKNCRIHDGADSGIYFFDNARGQIVDCAIYGNQNVGAAITTGANPLIKNCRIYEGDSGGVVAWRNGAAGVIENCEIFGHRLANVGVSDFANPTFRRCTIYGSRDAGIYLQQKGYGVFEECDVYENTRAEVAVTDDSKTILRRCTIHNGRESGVFVGSRAHALVESCNIYDNADAGVAAYGASVIDVRRCNIHRNGKVGVRVKENSAANVEDSDLRGNRLAAWETEYGIVIERKNNRE